MNDQRVHDRAELIRRTFVHVLPAQWDALVAELAEPAVEGHTPALSTVVPVAESKAKFRHGALVLLIQPLSHAVLPAVVHHKGETADGMRVALLPASREPVRL